VNRPRMVVGRLLPGLAVAVVVVLVGLVYTASHDVTAPLTDVLAGRSHVRWPPPARGALQLPIHAGVGWGLRGMLTWLALLAACGLLGAIAVARVRARRDRTMRVEYWEFALGRDDMADPFKVQEAFEGIAGSLSARWYRRVWSGQDHLALEILRDQNGKVTFLVAGLPGVIRVMRATIMELYPDVLLRRCADRPALSTDVIMRLKKARSYVLSLQTALDYRHAFSESLVAALDTAAGPTGVQIVLTPAPRLLHRRSRFLLKARERAGREELDSGGSMLESKEIRGALMTQHSSLLYFDVRVFAERRQDAAQIAGLFAQLRAENEFVRRDMRLRRQLFAARIAVGQPNLLPGLHSGLVSTPELATLWQLPRARVKNVRLNRSTIRRAIAPVEVDRTPLAEIMRDEAGPVGLAVADRKFGHALIGGQGGGKSSVMARSLSNAARDPKRAIVLFDPKGPLAELALGLIAENRTVHYLDLAEPQFGVNPLLIDAKPAIRASLVVKAMIEANAAGAIQAASDSFLRQAISAVCQVESHPTFWHVYRMFDFAADSAYRRSVVDRLGRIPGADFARSYWQREFPTLIGNRGFAVQSLNPPRNKIERLISTPEIDMMFRHPLSLDFEQIIEHREVLIICGSKATVGEDNAVFVMQILLQLLHRALQARQKAGEAPAQRPVSLFIDEAHNLLTPSVATMLAEGRSAGLEACFAWQYSAQIADEVIRSGLQSLLQSISIFRMREIEDARSLAGLAMEVYSDRISADLVEQERLRFSADDIVRLPAHRAINLWIAAGIPRPGFIAESLPMESLYHPGRATSHQQAQRDRGGHVPVSLGDPLADWVSVPVAAARASEAPMPLPGEALTIDLEDLT
jgi:hypothetical protein